MPGSQTLCVLPGWGNRVHKSSSSAQDICCSIIVGYFDCDFIKWGFFLIFFCLTPGQKWVYFLAFLRGALIHDSSLSKTLNSGLFCGLLCLFINLIPWVILTSQGLSPNLHCWLYALPLYQLIRSSVTKNSKISQRIIWNFNSLFEKRVLLKLAHLSPFHHPSFLFLPSLNRPFSYLESFDLSSLNTPTSSTLLSSLTIAFLSHPSPSTPNSHENFMFLYPPPIMGSWGSQRH